MAHSDLQAEIRQARDLRNLAQDRGYHDVARFWQDMLDQLRSHVPQEPHSSVSSVTL
jgi:hypothetical protein